MDELVYYLPVIILVIVVAAALFWGVEIVREVIRAKRGEITCMYCKAAASKSSQREYLFLIPISFGDQYGDAENYLRSHMRPIMGKDQIPTGQRACKLELYRCSKCDKEQVGITDFLQVRGEEYTKGCYVFSYESFRTLLEEWERQL